MRSLFVRLLEVKYQEKIKVVERAEKADLSFFSAFPFSNKWDKLIKYGLGIMSNRMWWDYVERSDYGFSLASMTKAKRVIWFTPENLRPPFREGIFTISFDNSDAKTNNFYFPFIHWRLDWGFDTQERIHLLTPDSLINDRKQMIRPFSGCSFSRSREPARMKLYSTVAKIMPVDMYGKAFNRPVTSKLEVAANYGFQICPENSLYPGYVTEKVFEAWFSGNIPIWQGLDSHCLVNENAIINVTGMAQDQILQRIAQISEEEMLSIRSQPILLKRPEIDSLGEFIQEALHSPA